MRYILPQKYLHWPEGESGMDRNKLESRNPFCRDLKLGENQPSLTRGQIHFWQHWDNVLRDKVDFSSAMASKSGSEDALLLWQAPWPALWRWSGSTVVVLPSGLTSIYVWLNCLQGSLNSAHEQFYLFTASAFVHCLLSCNNGYAMKA